MGDEAAEEVMNRVRENNYAERVKRREDMYSKQRKLVAELSHSKISEEYKEEDIIKAAQNLASSSKEKEKSFSDLKNSFIQNPCHMVTFMKIEGALHSLVGHLMSQNSFDQLLAAECCCNLSLGDSKTCFKLAKAASPYLMSILQGLNHNLMNVVLQTVMNLSGSGLKTCQLLHSQGILQALERTMSIPELREQTTKALIMFTKNGPNYMTENEVQNMVNFILPFFELSDKVQWLIYLLSSQPYVIQVLIQHDIPIRVLKMLSSLRRLRADNIISVTSLVRMLGNLSADPDGITASLMLDKWDMTLVIIKFFLASKYRHLCKEVYWSLGNILQHKNPDVQKKLSLRTHDLTWLGSRVSLPTA